MIIGDSGSHSWQNFTSSVSAKAPSIAGKFFGVESHKSETQILKNYINHPTHVRTISHSHGESYGNLLGRLFTDVLAIFSPGPSHDDPSMRRSWARFGPRSERNPTECLGSAGGIDAILN